MLRNLTFTLIACIIITGCKSGGTVTAPPKRDKYAAIIAPLIDPAKLDTLKGGRGGKLSNKENRLLDRNSETEGPRPCRRNQGGSCYQQAIRI